MPKVQMPQLGESVAEGTIGKWLKKPGDHVDKYEPLVEVITDKVNAEVPSPFEGTLTEILAQEGETVPNNADIAVIEAVGEAAEATAQPPAEAGAAAEGTEAEGATETGPEATADETAAQAGGHGPAGSDERPERPERPEPPERPTPEPSSQQPTEQPVSAATAVAAPARTGGNGAAGPDGYQGPTTPAVRRLAREHNVDLSLVAGSGHGGRVTRDDVLKFVESGGAQEAAQAPAQQAAPAATPVPAAPSAPSQAAAPSAPSPVAQGDALKQASPMRRAIATQMTRALQVPVAYTIVEVDMSGVVALRNATKSQYQAQEGVSLTLDAFVANATVEALKKHADFNAHYTDEGHWRRASVNLGIAVAVEDGLVVPVVKNADRLSIHGLNQQIRDLAERARAGKLKLDEIQGGTFTLDNTGWTGSIITAPIINTPEVGILTMESIVKRPVVVESATGDSIAIKPMMYMCLGFDHRATDGAQAGRFIGDVKRWLEAVDSTTAIW